MASTEHIPEGQIVFRTYFVMMSDAVFQGAKGTDSLRLGRLVIFTDILG